MTDDQARLIATDAYNLDWASVVFPEPTAQLTTTLEQTAAATGLSEDLTARLFDAWELPRPQPGQALRADDDELLHLAVPALEGFRHDQTALLAAARQLGDSLRRLAESQVRRFHTHVEEHLRAEGHADHSWSDDLNQVAASMMASLDRTLVLLYRRHFEHYVLDVTMLRAEAALERAGLARRRPVRPPAIAFLDLTGYTKLTEERVDRAAAELAGQLVEIVHEFAHRYLMHRLHCSPTVRCRAGRGRESAATPAADAEAQRLRDSRDCGEARAFSPKALSRSASPACSSA